VSAASATLGTGSALLGRTFGPALFDYLLIGGGLSLIWTGVILWTPIGPSSIGAGDLALIILLANSTHFAASTVRLYTMPGAREAMPRLTLVFPLVALAVLTLAIAGVDEGGGNLYALYLTWSPYHFAAQAFGLAVMYSYRSGCVLSATDKRLLRWTCLMPFFHSFLAASGAGASWLVPADWLGLPAVGMTRDALRSLLRVLVFVTPFLVFAKVWRSGRPMPLISLLVVLANGVWWITLTHLNAFLWATVFHGIQYLMIVFVFHAKEQTALPGNRHGPLYHSLWFYGACLVLAYALFRLLPLGYVWLGFGYTESLLLVVAAINLHHFVVDGFIWRLGRGGSNRRIVDEGLARAA
jgi:hypothetical protein